MPISDSHYVIIYLPHSIEYPPKYLLENRTVIARETVNRIDFAIRKVNSSPSPRDRYVVTRLINDFNKHLDTFIGSFALYLPKEYANIAQSSSSISDLLKTVERNASKAQLLSSLYAPNRKYPRYRTTSEEIAPIYFFFVDIDQAKPASQAGRANLARQASNETEKTIDSIEEIVSDALDQNKRFMSKDIYIRSNGWSEDELEGILEDEEAFLADMQKLSEPNYLLAKAILTLKTTSAFQAIAQYLISLQIEADWNESLSDITYWNASIIVAHFCNYYWHDRVDSFRSSKKAVENNLDRLLGWAQQCNDKLRFQFLGELQYVGHDKVVEFAQNLLATIDNKSVKSLIRDYETKALSMKYQEVLSKTEVLDRSHTPLGYEFEDYFLKGS